MTAVLFKFSHPDGTPVVDAPFLVTTRKPSFDETLNNGIQVSGDVNGTTDAQGEATLELMAGFATYYLIMNNPGAVLGDDGCSAGLRYRFMVTESSDVLRVEDLIVTTPTWSRHWDETALQIIIDAKVTATAAADAAAASAAYVAEQVGILDGIEDRVTILMNRAETGADEAEAAEVNAEAARDSSEAFAVDALASVGLTQIDSMEAKAAALEAQAAVAAPMAAHNLPSWALVQNFRLVSDVVRDENDTLLSAVIEWPDDVAGTFTADIVNSEFPGAIDAWHATYAGPPSKLITQTAYVRNANGAIMSMPKITIV
jgi:hypothetical protein